MVAGPARNRREREEIVRKELQSSKQVVADEGQYYGFMPERFQKYMVDQELRGEYFRNRSQPCAKRTETGAKGSGLARVNNIRAIKHRKGKGKGCWIFWIKTWSLC